MKIRIGGKIFKGTIYCIFYLRSHSAPLHVFAMFVRRVSMDFCLSRHWGDKYQMIFACSPENRSWLQEGGRQAGGGEHGGRRRLNIGGKSFFVDDDGNEVEVGLL